MQQKLNWTLYLIIGISLFSTRCAKTSYIVTGDYYYINTTGSTITIKNRPGNMTSYNTYTLEASDTLKLTTIGETASKVAEIRGYIPPLAGDTTVVIFNDTTCYYEFSTSGLYFNRIDAYDNVQISNRHYQFYLTIDSSIVNLSSNCL